MSAIVAVSDGCPNSANSCSLLIMYTPNAFRAAPCCKSDLKFSTRTLTFREFALMLDVDSLLRHYTDRSILVGNIN